MKCYLQVRLIVLMVCSALCAWCAPQTQTHRRGLVLIENKGQVTDQFYNRRTDIDFKLAAAPGLNVFVGAGHIHYQWTTTKDSITECYRMDVHLLNSNPNAELIWEAPQTFYEIYYTHLTGENGIRAQSYKKATYRNVYPNIDWVFYVNNEGKLEHDFIVHPGGRVSDIQLRYEGVTDLRVDERGRLQAHTPFGSIIENAPYSFQDDGTPIASRFVLTQNTLRLETDPYQGVLTIDPVLEWGTYFGGSATDIAFGVTNDVWGNVYMVGQTLSTDNIATTGVAFHTFNGGSNDAFVSRFNRDGDCIWAMYYGGEKVDIGKSVGCDTLGNLYFAGTTTSTGGIATAGSHQENLPSNSHDIFIVKLDSSGVRAWATYFGGNSYEGDNAVGLAIAKSGTIYLTGNTSSSNGVTFNCKHQCTHGGGNDGFLACFSTNGVQLWGTYFGGSNADVPYAIALGQDESIVITGSTQSLNNIATPNAHRTTVDGLPANRAAFLAKFNKDGEQLWGTYLGGNTTDHGYTVAVDHDNNVIVAGFTNSDTGFATPGGHQMQHNGSGDGFIAKFNENGQFLWSTYFGGDKLDQVNGIAASQDGMIYCAGRTASSAQITTPDGYQPNKITESGTQDAGFLVKFSSNGTQLWGTYFAGSHRVRFNGITIDPTNNLFLIGETRSATHIPYGNAYQNALGGSDDAILIRFNDCTAPDTPGIIGASYICNGVPTQYYTPGVAGAHHYTWMLPNGWIGSSTSDTIVVEPYHTDGIISLVAHNACGRVSDTQTLSVVVSKIPELDVLPSPEGCAGDTILITTSKQSGFTYAWLQDDNPTSGADHQLQVVQSGRYQVISSDGQCSDTSVATTIIIHPLPVPIIDEEDGKLFTTQSFDQYQWYYEGTPINGAVDPICEARFAGTYQVQVTDSNGCTNVSDEFAYGDINAVAATNANPHLQIYPNPAQDRLFVQSQHKGLLYILTLDGSTVLLQQQLAIGATELDIASLPSGLYLLGMQLETKEWIHLQKLIKL